MYSSVSAKSEQPRAPEGSLRGAVRPAAWNRAGRLVSAAARGDARRGDPNACRARLSNNLSGLTAKHRGPPVLVGFFKVKPQHLIHLALRAGEQRQAVREAHEVRRPEPGEMRARGQLGGEGPEVQPEAVWQRPANRGAGVQEQDGGAPGGRDLDQRDSRLVRVRTNSNFWRGAPGIPENARTRISSFPFSAK